MSSDVMVYFVDNRRWINVTIPTSERPEFLLYPTFTYYKGSSFLLYGGTALKFTHQVDGESRHGIYQDCKELPCGNETSSFSNVITQE